MPGCHFRRVATTDGTEPRRRLLRRISQDAVGQFAVTVAARPGHTVSGCASTRLWPIPGLSCQRLQAFLCSSFSCGEVEALAHCDAALEHPAGFVGVAQQRPYVSQVAQGYHARFVALRGALLSLSLRCVDVSIRRPASGCLEIRFPSVGGRHRLGRWKVFDQGRSSDRLERRLSGVLCERRRKVVH